MKFKKVLSAMLASLTLLGAVPAGAVGCGLKEKAKLTGAAVCKSLVGVAAAVGLGVGLTYVGYKCFYSDTITVGKPGQNLTKDDFKQYLSKEEIKVGGLMANLAGYAGKTFYADVVCALNIKIRDGVTGIEEDAFADCINVKKIIIPGSVQYIEENALRFASFNSREIIYNGKKYSDRDSFLKEFWEKQSN